MHQPHQMIINQHVLTILNLSFLGISWGQPPFFLTTPRAFPDAALVALDFEFALLLCGAASIGRSVKKAAGNGAIF